MSESQEVTRVLVVDDHPIVRHGVAQLIDLEQDLEVCGEAENVPQAMELLRAEKPGVAVVDITLDGGVSGLDFIRMARAESDSLQVLVLSMHDEGVYAERALRVGARGYLMKQEATTKVVDAIREILKGNIFVSNDVAMSVLQGLSAGQAEGASPIDRLTDRELEVFQLIGDGYAPRHVAEALCMSVRTVETHRDNIKQKLGLDSAAELTRYAVRWKQEQSKTV